MKYLIILLILFSAICAHPHMFMSTEAVFNFKEQNLDNVRVKWIFDEMTSMQIIADVDQDLDLKINPAEKAVIEKEYFTHLAEYNFYTDLRVNKKKSIIKEVKDFNAYIINENVIVYEFTIPVSVSKKSKNNVILKMIDETIFIAFSTEQKEVITSGNCLISEPLVSKTAVYKFIY